MTVKRLLFILSVIAVTVLGLALRMSAVDRLPYDFDEDDYLGAAQRYALAFKAGDLQAVINYPFNYEHPPLTKLAYAAVILPLPEATLLPESSPSAPIAGWLPQPHFQVARLLSAALGSMQVFLLALINPLAGFFLAVNTWHIKYTSQIMLEPLPSLFSTLAVIFYYYSRRQRPGWLLLAALALGLTAASKYPYAIVGLVILGDWLWRSRPEGGGRSAGRWVRWLLPPLLWGACSVAVFFAANPRLWIDPLPRLIETLSFHGSYAYSEHVAAVGFPPWQPLIWLFQPVPWHPGVFYILLDLYIALFALLGWQRAAQRQPIFAAWLAVGLIFLLLWPTKWAQYVLMIAAPLSISAAEGFTATIVEPARGWLAARRDPNRQKSRPRIPARETWRALLWLLPGLAVLGFIFIYPMLFQGAMTLTDFGAMAIKDGLNGGVWREVWGGLSGQIEAREMQFFTRSSSRQVHYTGFDLLAALFSGGVPDVMVFSVLWTVFSVVSQTTLGVVTALLLNKSGVRFKGWWRALFVLPWAIPEFVGALIWSQILDPKFGWLGFAGQTWAQTADYPGAGQTIAQWQQEPAVAFPLLVIIAAWYGFPFMMLAAAAGLKMIPKDVYDASAIDGANRWQEFRHITWPLIYPLLIPAIIIRAIFAFNQFYLFYVMYFTPEGMLTFSTLSFWVFNDGGMYALSAAINLFTVAILVGLILWFNRWSKAAEGVTYA
jgi:ABC-type sugar transport system permease subunit